MARLARLQGYQGISTPLTTFRLKRLATSSTRTKQCRKLQPALSAIPVLRQLLSSESLISQRELREEPSDLFVHRRLTLNLRDLTRVSWGWARWSVMALSVESPA